MHLWLNFDIDWKKNSYILLILHSSLVFLLNGIYSIHGTNTNFILGQDLGTFFDQTANFSPFLVNAFF